MIWIVAVLLGLLLTCHGSSSGGQCSEDIVLSEPLGGGCGDAEGVPHLHEDHHLGSFSPVIANADDIRRQWQNCIRRNRGECSGGSAALEEPRFSLDSPRDEAGHKLFQHLDNLGSGSQDQRVLILRLGGRPNACAYQGLWGKVQRFVAALAWATAHDHAVVFQQTDNWIGVGPGWCPEKSWLCFFQPLNPHEHINSAASIRTWQNLHAPETTDPDTFEPYRCLPAIPIPRGKHSTSLEELAPHTASDALGWSACMHDNQRCGTTGSGLPAGIPKDHMSNRFFGGRFYVPDDFKNLPGSARGGLALPVWWEAHLSRYLLRPRKFVMDYIDRSKQTAGWPSQDSVIGVHVRRGDKYDNDQDVPVFEEYYLPHILELSRNFQIKNIFVASDSPHITNGLQQGTIKGASESDLNWLTFGKDQQNLPEFAHFADMPGVYSKAHWYRGLKGNDRLSGNQFTANTLASIRDVWLLGQCHHFVGTRVSAVSRYASKLLLGNRLASATGPSAQETHIRWPDFPGIDRYR